MQKPEIRKREFIIDDYCITRVAKPSFEINENIVNVNFDFFIKNLTNNTVEEFSESHSMRHFSSPELKIFAELNDLKVISFEEFLTGKKPGDNTWGVCFILIKT